MRLRTFIGRTTAEAMVSVRAHLGPEAMIVSAQHDRNGNARVTAALDEGSAMAARPPAAEAVIGEALAFHGVAPALRGTLVAAALDCGIADAEGALAAGLSACFSFAPIAAREPRAVLLVGAPGAGKTVTAAKLATRDVLAGRRVRLITADLARAGGVAQLAAFASILQIPIEVADGATALGARVAAASPAERLIIDTAAVNPFNAGERRELAGMIAGAAAEPILALAAGGDAADSSDAARIFAELGCTCAIVTRLDASQRLGSVLAAADAAGLAFAEAGLAPDIADGLAAFSATFLARLLLPKDPT